jgi:hypothetical protein
MAFAIIVVGPLGACQPSAADAAHEGYSVDGRPVPSIASSRPSYTAGDGN